MRLLRCQWNNCDDHGYMDPTNNTPVCTLHLLYMYYIYSQTFSTRRTKSQSLNVLYCSCLCPIHWSQMLSREWRCSWSNAYRPCSNYTCVTNNFVKVIPLYHWSARNTALLLIVCGSRLVIYKYIGKQQIYIRDLWREYITKEATRRVQLNPFVRICVRVPTCWVKESFWLINPV